MWRSEELVLQMYRGSRVKSVRKVEKPLVKPTIQKSKRLDLKTLMSTKKRIGTGEFGETYDLENGQVLKVIRVMDSLHEQVIREEVSIHKEVQDLVLPADGIPCVPPILNGPDMHQKHDQMYITYSMPKLTPFVKNEENIDRLLMCVAFLVAQGYLHNDLHQGNIMTYQGHAIIIDLGLMIRYTPPTSNDLLRCIVFAQCAALIDNCNENTACPLESYLAKLSSEKNFVIQFFGLRKKETLKSMMKKIDKLSDDDIIRSQLLLSCLSTHFYGCTYDTKICDEGEYIGDYIYAIRNPLKIKMTLQQILQSARNKKRLPS